MKEYFKYKCGYINIDDENLYTTDNGNWQETKKLEEKRAYKKRRPKHIDGNILTFMRILPIAWVIASTAISFQTSWYTGLICWTLFIILLIIAGKYFDLLTPHRIKIPLKKIEKIETLKEKVKINFENAGNQPDFIFVEKPEEKAIELLSALKK